MQVEISRLTEKDIPGAISAIQEAFEEDPYNRWVYDDREKVRDSPFPLMIMSTQHSPPSMGLGLLSSL